MSMGDTTGNSLRRLSFLQHRIYNLLAPSPATLLDHHRSNALLQYYTATGAEGWLGAEWLACWTQAQKGLGSNRSRDAVG